MTACPSPMALLGGVAGLAVAIVGTGPAGAYDAALALKWATAEVVRYDVVGVYDGARTMVVEGGYARVQDRVEMTFKWKQGDMVFAGAPVFKNFTTNISNLQNFEPKCRAPTITQPYEHFTLSKLEVGLGGAIAVSSTRSLAAANVPQVCTDAGKAIAAKKIDDVEQMAVPGSTLFAMAKEASTPDLFIDAATSTIVVKKDDWTWTHKLSPSH